MARYVHSKIREAALVLLTREHLMSKSRADELILHARTTGRYANVFRVGFNAFEMVVEFGEQFADGEQAQMHTRVITNPVFARGLAESLNEALSRYANAYSCELPDT
jgi:hypothetical protein